MSIQATLRPNRLSIRLRLTLLYGGTVLACGIALLITVYALMRYIPTYDVQPIPAMEVATPAFPTAPAEAPIAVNITSKDDFLLVLLQLSGVALTGLALVSFLIGWIIAGRILAPVHRIARTARTVAGNSLHERIHLDGPKDEFTELADTIDTMLDRLHTSFQAQQRFAANASHELRTPLATTRTMLQVAIAHPDDHDLATLAPKLLATNERSIATVESLLALSRADHGIDEAEPVHLTAVAEHALEQVRAEAAAGRIALHDDLRPAHVIGDENLLHHLVINLLHNAIRHNRADGTARLTTATRNGTAVITVTNTGEVITPEDAERLFEPFHRVRARTHTGGHGLGLTLVRAIAHSHHGTATATPNPDGGLTATITLPS
ncbi:Signal transduction histidine kinase [Saccharopolyspora antimicrobica]|uniref:histidine kinase n=1 Tax=Saccharopolyspora antimicrobica TaxID=455193 RepID=A0A1I4YHI0_9PSEU|nr:HAMP domain-containing sensor histidine kinase [Saccharopolyspora antimicrobica]RKT82679.1 signal transduction histidine kinase [Saccharopolyspora antimicrobica]SFN37514.1 Signal transduction histidine kinase [Saccharopolyspora antimicrobica]